MDEGEMCKDCTQKVYNGWIREYEAKTNSVYNKLEQCRQKRKKVFGRRPRNRVHKWMMGAFLLPLRLKTNERLRNYAETYAIFDTNHGGFIKLLPNYVSKLRRKKRKRSKVRPFNIPQIREEDLPF